MISFGTLIFALVLAEVTSWTIDLPEARKFLFEKNDRLEKEQKQYKSVIDKQVFFSNRYDSNSKHHEEPHDDHNPYAKEYGYQSYMEKKVRDIVYDGSEYLDGLQRSIEDFTKLLENCTRMNQTNAAYRFNETAFNTTLFNSNNFTSTTSSPEPWRPINERAPYNITNFLNTMEQCRKATRASEHVRRLAALAMKATKELQDIAYSRKYLKDDPYDLSKEENELILKLAWFLDRLAYYTGYHPHPQRYLNDGYSTSTTALPPLVNMLNASEDTKRQMMDCLKQKSNVPATIRCAYPQEIPAAMQFLINNSNPMPAGVPSSSNRNERVVSPSQPSATDQELLIASDYRPYYLPYHHLTPVIVKRSLPEQQVNLSKRKRSVEDPAIIFMKYFIKHKVWEGSNTEHHGKGFEQFEVTNQIPHRAKRAAYQTTYRGKRATNEKRLQTPENPFQDLSKYAKSKKGVSYVKDEVQAQKIRSFIDKILNSKSTTAKEHSRRISKLFRSKRSYTYETDVDKPRDPEDLFKDISYYIKNKPGTNFNRDFVQAAQVRAGLEQIFLNPNIETVRRYGANFNPLIPDPLLFGTLRSSADN